MYGTTRSNQMDPVHGLCLTFLLLCVLWSTCTSVSAAARPLRYTNPVFLDTPVNITVDSGQEAIIPCAVENLGPKSVIWKKVSQRHPITIGEYVFAPDSRYFLNRQRTQIANPEWNLHIRDVQPSHAGMYECQISAKEDIVRHVQLHVRDTGKKPKSGIRLMGTSFVEKGRTIKLNCTASAKDYSPQGVDWFKDGLKLRASERIAISSTLTRKDNTVHSKLEIKRSNMSDAGTYVCRSSQYHIASLKVIVLNAETTNVFPITTVKLRRTRDQENRSKQMDQENKVLENQTYVSPYLCLYICSSLGPQSGHLGTDSSRRQRQTFCFCRRAVHNTLIMVYISSGVFCVQCTPTGMLCTVDSVQYTNLTCSCLSDLQDEVFLYIS